ncbi:hypothetical protein [Bradyrhizobium sp. CCBAU 45389]|uniref:hypothetical protein n=1 Tax=Bradyrhizobium sp. CCBAU 45389 TaxID=858429 RepID=UPI0023051E46|nr:hypothetical protein [Bradyrhizobium sp. CCBAU 45389]MDA9399020.1 hypothetical protein [Bradyrhizobium sp. CCBAU 45389]
MPINQARMKSLFSTTAALVFIATTALAEGVSPLPKVQQAGDTEAEDCSKQVWRHFSQACLRSEGKGVAAVRLVTHRASLAISTPLVSAQIRN